MFWVQYTKAKIQTNMDSDLNKTKQKVRQELANYLGVDLEDIEDESVLAVDLHMTALDLTDFEQVLKNNSFDTSKIDFTEIETFEDLIEGLTLTA